MLLFSHSSLSSFVQSSLLVTTETGVEALLLPPVALRGDCAAVEVSEVRSPPSIAVPACGVVACSACAAAAAEACSELGLSRGLLLLQGGLTCAEEAGCNDRFCG